MRRERGVALLTVLLLVAVMTAIAVGMLDDIRFGLRRAANAQGMAQAQWYALGAETLARAQIERLGRRDGQRTTLTGDWNDRPLAFPIEGGLIRARVRDATACFNLNSVVEGAGEMLRRRDQGVRQFLALLAALEVEPRRAQALADALVDWIDSDARPEPFGAEDTAYAARGYLPGNTLLAEPSELRALEGMDAALYARLRRHVCALPTTALSPVNVNTLGEDDALILVMLTEGALGVEEARAVLARRPRDGWRDFASFWSLPQLAALPVLDQVSLRSRYFALHAEVEVMDAEAVLTALFEHDAGGRVRLLARRWTPDE
ncbi:type II secretion system minor pseudopilin GspK [Coralloluteibacterium thermophilus]|uniref:Type II secretion system protein K n=1 Tax=Coralloluteibacterium thermophilum TaxID=2707049 RepID=A0ABV9NP21_9GAMM